MVAKTLFSLSMSEDEKKEIITSPDHCVSDSVKHEWGREAYLM